MIERFSTQNLTWIDVTHPTPEEVHELVSEVGIPLVLATDLTSMTPRSEVLAEKKVLKLTLDFPIVRRTDITHPHEVKFIATKSHLVTVRFEDITVIHQFAKEFEVLSLLKKKKNGATGVDLMLTLLDKFYHGLDDKLDYLESKMTSVEEGIFAEREREMVFEISNLGRRLINFRQVLHSHEVVLEQLSSEVTGKQSGITVPDVIKQYWHVRNRVRALSQTLDELRETNNSLLTTKQNEVMKTFTILAFITFPLTLFTSLFGMNTVTTPLVGQPGDFWLILGIMVLVSISFFAYFRYRKWM